MRTYMSDPISNPDFLNGCAKDAPFKRMLFGMAFFHSIVQVRRKKVDSLINMQSLTMPECLLSLFEAAKLWIQVISSIKHHASLE